MAAQGGKSKGVRVVTDAELADNTFEIQPGPVTRVAQLDATVRGVMGGLALPVYPVTLAEANRRGMLGGKGVPVTDITTERKVGGSQIAMPVYVVSGSLGVVATPVSVCLTWDDNSDNETAFVIERSPDDVVWTQIASLAADATSYEDDTVVEGTLYYYRVGALLVANWWEVAGQTVVAAYQPIGAINLATSYINLSNPGTFNAAPGVAPTWDAADGWAFNGSTQFLTTGINAVYNRIWSMIIRFSGAGTSAVNRCIGGASATSSFGRFYMLTSKSATDDHEYAAGNATATLSTGVRLASGVQTITGSHGYLDGFDEGQIPGSTYGTPGPAIYLGARDAVGSADLFFDGKIQAVAIYSTQLMQDDVLNLTNFMELLPNGLVSYSNTVSITP